MFCRSLQRPRCAWLVLATLMAPLAEAQVKPGASPPQLDRVTRWTTGNGLPLVQPQATT
ncbi:MAG: hypothetical protein ABSF95_04160 [Verrucomicrobiota bacterium]|jgi:hypothetical protein